MIDGFGREINYIRISVTDRCNLRCVYCMPETGVEMLRHDDILSFDEILRLAGIFADLGICRIKLTGGEPLVRKDIAVLVKELKRIPGIEQVTLTTNGVLLAEHMEQLADAGINGVNLSLDTLNPDIFAQITRRDEFEKVMEGFQKALSYSRIPLKINCVPMGIPGQNILDIAELARKYAVHVRYIEMMPIGLGKQFTYCSEDEILAALKEKYGDCERLTETLGNGPGRYVSFPGFIGKIGFISAVSHKFCASCNRVRLTSQGFLKTCLQYETGTDLKNLLRGSASDSEIKSVITETIGRKPEGHRFSSLSGENGETHIMSQIGG